MGRTMKDPKRAREILESGKKFPAQTFVPKATAERESRLASFRLLPAEDLAGAARFRHELPLRKSNDITLEIDHGLAAIHDPRPGFEQSVRHGPEVIDLEFNRGERFALLEERCAGKSHRGVSQVAENAAVQRAHRIRVFVGPRLETEDCRPFLDLDWLKTNQGGDGRRKIHPRRNKPM